MKMRTTILMIVLTGGVTFGLSAREATAQTSALNHANHSAGTQKTLTGIVSDAMCGKTHMAKDKTAAECTRMCVQQGQKYALVVGQKVYTLQGHQDDLNKLAGERVNVKGKIIGDTLTVSSVAAAKKKSS